jgi:hypothetical protein
LQFGRTQQRLCGKACRTEGQAQDQGGGFFHGRFRGLWFKMRAL